MFYEITTTNNDGRIIRIAKLEDVSEEFARGYACCFESVVNEGFADCEEEKEIISLWLTTDSYRQHIYSHK